MISSARVISRLAFCGCLLSAVKADAQLSVLYQSVPGTLAAYQYQAGTIQTVMVPVDLTLSFSNDNPTSTLTASIFKPIIGAKADGTPIYPIAGSFPMRVTGTSQNGQDFHGDLLGTQYLFDWKFEPGSGSELVLNGRVYWAGGRIELTTINNARLIPAVAGDYNRDGTVNAADYAVWRGNVGTTNLLPNDPIGGAIGTAQYIQWRANVGNSSGTTITSIPEPTNTALVALAAACLVSLMRRHT